MSDIRRIPFSLIQKGCEFQLKKGIPLGQVLMFHQVNEDMSVWEDARCAITASAFGKLISGVQCVKPLSSVIDSKNVQNTFITFDDAYDDVYKTAASILLDRNLPFAVFVAPSLLNTGRFLTCEHLRTLAEHPLCTVGAHTMSHKMLRQLPVESAKQEIEQSKAILEDMLGKEVSLFAYPYGSIFACSKQNIQQVQAAGYQMAFSTLHSTLTSKNLKNRWFLPRLNINEENYLYMMKQIGEKNV